MAITGTGTELDPFIVHSYDELKYACEQHGSTSVRYYTKLANDIDCNDYGSDFEWQTITLGSNASGANKNNSIDFDGHTIKNVFIKQGNKLFDSTGNNLAEIKNGKILNVFGSSISGFIPKTVISNMSISVQIGTTSSNYLFDSCPMSYCALYVIFTNADGKAIMYVAGANTVNNIDMYFEMYNCTMGTKITNASSTSNGQIDSVRFVGKMKLKNPEDPPTPQNGVWISGKATNSVFDIDFTDYDYSQSSAQSRALFGGAGDNTTVINWEKVPHAASADYTASGYLKATTAQMTVGSELRGLGFLVVNVEE